MSLSINTQSSQLGAGCPSLQDILSTVHNGSLGSDVHPLVLEAVVQAVLSKSKAEASTSLATNATVDGRQASNNSGNPYWHLTKTHVPETNPYQQWSTLPTYDAFWSNFERNEPTSCARTPLGATSQNTAGTPARSAGIPLSMSVESHSIGSTSSFPSSSASPERQNPAGKRKAASLDKMARHYPALAEFIRVIPMDVAEKNSKVDPFPCNRCRQTVGGELTAIRQHLVDVHSVLERKTSARCIFPGCEKSVLAGQMGSHIVTHQTRDLARCGLCGRGFTRTESVVQHISSGTCQIIKAADAAEGLQHRHKRTKHTV